jgi:hypothetical protein
MNHWQATKFGNYPNNLLAMTKKLVRLCFDSNPNTTCVLRHTSDTWFYFAKQPDIRFCWSLGFVFYGLSQTRVYAQIVKLSSCPADDRVNNLWDIKFILSLSSGLSPTCSFFCLCSRQQQDLTSPKLHNKTEQTQF